MTLLIKTITGLTGKIKGLNMLTDKKKTIPTYHTKTGNQNRQVKVILMKANESKYDEWRMCHQIILSQRKDIAKKICIQNRS